MAKPLDLKKTKETLDKLLAQAKESVKVLEALREEGFARAKAFIPPLPSKGEAQKMANEKLVSSLRKVGLATRSEVKDLENKVEELASELRGKISKVAKKKKSKSGHKDTSGTNSD